MALRNESLKCRHFRNESNSYDGAQYQNEICRIALEDPFDQSSFPFSAPGNVYCGDFTDSAAFTGRLVGIFKKTSNVSN